MTMKYLCVAFSLVLATLSGTAAFAQSSGSFSASFDKTQCSITESDGTLAGGIEGNSLPPVTVKVSGGNGVALVITPSLVTGLFTKNKLSSLIPTSTQNVGIRVKVEVDGSTANVVPEVGSDGVIYDQRFIQVNASFLTGLATCIDECFTLVESTLSAHSFNFYVSNLTPGTHTINVSWDMVGGLSGEAVCIGPGVLAVQQVKNFSFNTGITLP
jgi:hypothetical protein